MPLVDPPMNCCCGAKRRRLGTSTALYVEEATCTCLGGAQASLLRASLPVITTGSNCDAYQSLWRAAQGPVLAAGPPHKSPSKKRLLESLPADMCFRSTAPRRQIDESQRAAWCPKSEPCASLVSKLGGRLALRPLARGRDGASRKRHCPVDVDPCIPAFAHRTSSNPSTSASAGACAPAGQGAGRLVCLRPIPASEQFARQPVAYWPAPHVAADAGAKCACKSGPTSPSPSGSTTTSTTASTTTSTPTSSASSRPAPSTSTTTTTTTTSAAATASGIPGGAAAAARAGPVTVTTGKGLNGSAAVGGAAGTASTATSRKTAPPAALPLGPEVYGRTSGRAGDSPRKILAVEVQVAAAVMAKEAPQCRAATAAAHTPHRLPLKRMDGEADRSPTWKLDSRGSPTVDGAAATAAAAVAGKPDLGADATQPVRLLLRLWPLAMQPQPLVQPQPQPLALADAGPGQTRQAAAANPTVPSCGGGGSPPRATIVPCSEQRRRGAANPGLASSWAPQQHQHQQPALGGLERLLEAAVAAAAAAAACEQSLASVGFATAAVAAASQQGAWEGTRPCGVAATPTIPRPLERQTIEPEAFFEVDGRLLKGSVLQTACHIIRLSQFGRNMEIVPPWCEEAHGLTGAAGCGGGGDRGTASGGSGGGSASVSAAAGRRAVPLAAVLKALVGYAGAARAVQRAQAGRGADAAEGLSALLPLMGRAYDCAETLMIEVERALTETPAASMDVCGQSS